MGKNEHIQAEIKKAGLRQWQVAEKFGVSETTFSKKMFRHPLTPEEQEKILSIIRELATTNEGKTV